MVKLDLIETKPCSSRVTYYKNGLQCFIKSEKRHNPRLLLRPLINLQLTRDRAMIILRGPKRSTPVLWLAVNIGDSLRCLKLVMTKRIHHCKSSRFKLCLQFLFFIFIFVSCLLCWRSEASILHITGAQWFTRSKRKRGDLLLEKEKERESERKREIKSALRNV